MYDNIEKHTGFAKGFGEYECNRQDNLKGKSFTVLGLIMDDKNGADLDTLPLWNIRFEDGYEIAAYPEEIFPREAFDWEKEWDIKAEIIVTGKGSEEAFLTLKDELSFYAPEFSPEGEPVLIPTEDGLCLRFVGKWVDAPDDYVPVDLKNYPEYDCGAKDVKVAVHGDIWNKWLDVEDLFEEKEDIER